MRRLWMASAWLDSFRFDRWTHRWTFFGHRRGRGGAIHRCCSKRSINIKLPSNRFSWNLYFFLQYIELLEASAAITTEPCMIKLLWILIGIVLACTMAIMHMWKHKFLPFFPLSFVVFMFTFTLVVAQLSSQQLWWQPLLSPQQRWMNPLWVNCVSSTLSTSGVSSGHLSHCLAYRA